jgi:hypothetical protein
MQEMFHLLLLVNFLVQANRLLIRTACSLRFKLHNEESAGSFVMFHRPDFTGRLRII